MNDDLDSLRLRLICAKGAADFFKWWAILWACSIFAGLALLLGVALLMGN